MKVNIKVIKTGVLEENCYVLIKNDRIIIIDPGDDYDQIKKIINNFHIEGILITHNHFDHIGALPPLLSEFKTTCYRFDNLEEKTYQLGPFKFKVIYTPGHSADSVSYYFYEDKVLFTGDFLFKETIGRTDLLTGSMSDMKSSLLTIKKYDKDILIYPGHGDSTNMDYELKNNLYLN